MIKKGKVMQSSNALDQDRQLGTGAMYLNEFFNQAKGLPKGQLITIASHSAQGKSNLATRNLFNIYGGRPIEVENDYDHGYPYMLFPKAEPLSPILSQHFKRVNYHYATRQTKPEDKFSLYRKPLISNKELDNIVEAHWRREFLGEWV